MSESASSFPAFPDGDLEFRERAKNEADCAESERQRRAEFEKNKPDMDRRYSKLPPVLQRRIDKFRANNPDFRWEYEGYELFCCEQAAVIAAALKTPERVREFHALDWEAQKQAVPGLNDGHSGNTFGCACTLAMDLLTTPENAAKRHGALAPLVGSQEYGCVPR